MTPERLKQINEAGRRVLARNDGGAMWDARAARAKRLAATVPQPKRSK